MVKHRNKPVLAYKEPWKQETGLNKSPTIVPEVTFFMGNPAVPNQYTGLSTKDETLETTVRNSYWMFPFIMISCNCFFFGQTLNKPLEYIRDRKLSLT